MSLRNARALQVLGILIALIGLSGFWLNRDIPDKAELNLEQKELLGLDTPEKEEVFHASFVVAGRDYDIARYASPCRFVEGRCVRDRTGEFQLGNRTDTILYMNIIGDKVTMVALPRDIYLPEWQVKVNEIYAYQGAKGLKQNVEDILGLPIDYYAVINIDIFKDLVDALDGVDVNIPYDMYYRDEAADLTIDFDEGPAHLNGEDAAKFIRYRHTLRGDIDRIENVKRLAYSMLARVKALNVRTALKAPELVDALFENVETNATPALVKSVLPRLASLQLDAATLPTEEVEGRNRLAYDETIIEQFLAETFGGEARVFAKAPEATLLVTNRSGEPGLAERYKARLVSMGVPEEQIVTRSAKPDPTPTLILTTAAHWQDADYYTSLLHASKQQVDRFGTVDGRKIDLELVLGENAAETALSQLLPSQVAAAN